MISIESPHSKDVTKEVFKTEGVDYDIAVKWYRLSAKQGNARAQHNLALMYQSGNGVLKDYEAAVYWYGRSARQGTKNAQINLAHMYFTGLGVKKNYICAYIWWRIAKENGVGNINNNIVTVRERMTPREIIHADKLVIDYLNKISSEY